MKRFTSLIIVTLVFGLTLSALFAEQVTVGIGHLNGRFPMDFYFKNSLYQTLYYAEELGIGTGTITALAFYNNFVTDLPSKPIKIWLGSTNQAELNSGFIPVSELSLVFDGTIDFPSGQNTINITLATPYYHLSGNLVMMVQRPMDDAFFSTSDNFKCQDGYTNRARYARSNTDVLNPAAPPAGTVGVRFPKTTFFYEVPPQANDIGCMNISGNQTPSAGINNPYLITIKNNGTNLQTNYQIKLMSATGAELASINGPALDSQQIQRVLINLNPAQAGALTIYGKVVLPEDEIPQNDETVRLSLNVQTGNQVSYTIGDGSQTARMPLDVYYNSSLHQYLIYPEDINYTTGLIDGIAFYNQFVSSLSNKPVRIWMSTTDVDELVTGFIPVTDHVPVFDGFKSFPSGANTIRFQFAEPFVYADGQNIIITILRPQDYSSYSSSDLFKAQSSWAPARTRHVYSDTEDFDPQDPPLSGTFYSQYAQTTLFIRPGGVGQITGTITNPAGAPLAGVRVSLNANNHQTISDEQGQYTIQNILEGIYQISFSAHAYQILTLDISIGPNETVTRNVQMQPIPVFSVSGTVLASDTAAGLSSATISLSGYDSYTANTGADGSFSIAGVYANHSYDYVISAAGYSSQTGVIHLSASNFDMGSITLDELAYAPMAVFAEAAPSNISVHLSWLAPDPSAMEITESFEEESFPPAGWTHSITNYGAANAQGISPTWCRVGSVNVSGDYVNPSHGNSQAGLFWDYEHQDEWLITPAFYCPSAARLIFDSYVFLGSTNQDHYYVKASTDGGNTWITLWDASAHTGGWNQYAYPIIINLSGFSGQQIKLAFQAVDGPENSGLWYVWFIDNIYIGNNISQIHFAADQLIPHSARASNKVMGYGVPSRNKSRAVEAGLAKAEPRLALANNTRQLSNSCRDLTGYKIWRFTAGNEDNEDAWTLLNSETVPDQEMDDTGWGSLPNGTYRWAVKAVYAAGIVSLPAFSNIVVRAVPLGMVAGVVRPQEGNQPIMGATISALGITATTNSAGAYTIILPVGSHDLTASAAGYVSQTITGVTVNENQTSTQNFLMVVDESDIPEELLPVMFTELGANYPNPFNPSTTISYSIKEAGKVKLEIFNIKGQLVSTLVNAEQTTGHYRIAWDGKDTSGKACASGVYYYRLSAEGYRQSRKMLLMK